MELVESYVQEVGQFLPEETRQEICQDLRSTIAEEVHAVADAAGRSATRQDQVEVLRRFGHPLKVASQYQPPRYVIGPDLYPVFLQTLKTVGVVGIGIQVLFFLVSSQIQQDAMGVIDLLGSSVQMLLWLFAIVTSVFVVLEYSGEKLNFYDNWQPEKLKGSSIGVINRQDVITNLLGEGVFLLWWNDVLVVSNWLPVMGQHLLLDTVWQAYFWPLNLLFGAAFMVNVWVLIRGVWHQSSLISEIVINVALLAAGAVLLTADNLVLITQVELQASNGALLQTIVRWVIVVLMAFTVWDVWVAFKTLRQKLVFAAQDEGAAA